MATLDFVNLPPVSMFQATPLYGMPDGTVMPGLIRSVLTLDPSDVVYIVTQATANRLEEIASQFYTTPEAWWVLAQVNNITDPWSDVVAGTRLRVPSRERLIAASILS